MRQSLKCLIAGLALAASVVLGTAAAEAHPHVWIVAKSELIYAPDGTITGVRHAWTFDDMFSTYALQGIETKVKGAYSREELAPLAQTNVESLKEYAYFTFARGDGPRSPASPDDILAEANAAARPYILTILPEQTVPPISLQTRNLLSEDQRGFYGFDMLNLDSYAQAGQPPTAITLADFSFDRETIASALSQSGYETTPLGDGTLYQLRGDNELDFQAPLATSQFPNLNRIVLVGNQMVIGSATQVVEQALSAQARDVPSLADNPLYVAAAEALADSSLTEWGTLVGVILIEGPALPQEPPPQLTEALADQFATYAAKPLPKKAVCKDGLFSFSNSLF